MKRKTVIFFGLMSLLFLLTGCVGKDGEIYDEQTVLDYVASICKEPYELVGKELIAQEPDHMEYTFRTKDRGLEFTASSYLSPIWIDASKTSFYQRNLSCSYVSQVHDQYQEQIRQILRTSDQYLDEYDWLYVVTFADVEDVVDVVLQADEIYGQERTYNSAEFLAENPLASIHLVWHRSEKEAEEHRNWVNMTNISVTGQNDRTELYERLAGQYAQLYVDGRIDKEFQVPREYLVGRHVSLLSEIELDGREMLYDDNSNPYGRFGLTTDDYKYCWYSEETDSYMMVIDIGWLSEHSSFPLIIREYVTALGGSYDVERQEDHCRSVWRIGDATWIMESAYSGDGIGKFTVEKNGEPLDISYITVDEDFQVRADFCVGIAVEDFCKLFDLSYVVEEENRRIMFSS